MSCDEDRMLVVIDTHLVGDVLRVSTVAAKTSIALRDDL
jgi:hypothetical protein